MAQNRQVPGTLQDGSVITVQGSTPPQANGFSINLASGPGDIGSSDVSLHLNPRFNENSVVRNSMQNGGWGAEERGGAGMPFQKGQPFECVILCRQDKYMMSFNGQHFGEFRHRLPMQRVTHVVVKGDVQLNNVSFSGPGMSGGGATPYGGGFGQPQPPPYSQSGGFGQPGHPGYGQPGQPGYVQPGSGFGQPQPMSGGYGGQPQPMSGGYGGQPGAGARVSIPGGMRPGRIVYFNGTPSPNAQRFSINIKTQEMGGDIALHFNPRFNERAVAMNSMTGGSWGQEQRANAPFPFTPGAQFMIMVLAEQNQFKIAVNGNHFGEYPVRNPNLQALQWADMDGDVTGGQINAP